MPKEEKLEAFSLTIEQEVPPSSLLFNPILEVLARAKSKGHKSEKRKPNYPCLQMTCSYINEKPKDSTEKLLEFMRNFGKLLGYKKQKQTRAFVQTMSQLRKNL